MRPILADGWEHGCMNTQPLSPDELLSTTRSVRKRLDLQRPVPIELVRECLRIAVQAPTGSNRQDWHWIVVTDAAARMRIGEYYRRSFERWPSCSAFPPTSTRARSSPPPTTPETLSGPRHACRSKKSSI
jgi:nitroreductase